MSNDMETEMKTYIGETACPLHGTILYVAIGIPEEDSGTTLSVE